MMKYCIKFYNLEMLSKGRWDYLIQKENMEKIRRRQDRLFKTSLKKFMKMLKKKEIKSLEYDEEEFVSHTLRTFKLEV